jgi:hypothetical protein
VCAAVLEKPHRRLLAASVEMNRACLPGSMVKRGESISDQRSLPGAGEAHGVGAPKRGAHAHPIAGIKYSKQQPPPLNSWPPEWTPARLGGRPKTHILYSLARCMARVVFFPGGNSRLSHHSVTARNAVKVSAVSAVSKAQDMGSHPYSSFFRQCGTRPRPA